MANFGYSRNERVYGQIATAYGLIPNAAGVATLAGLNCMRHIKVMLDPTVDLYPNPVKTGSRDILPGIPGRRVGTWTLDLPLQGNGAAGVLPDCDEILQCIFGQPAVVASTASCTYSMADAVLSFVLWRFRMPTTLVQQVGLGCIIKDCTFNFGQNVATWSVSGECVWVLDSEQFATTDAVAKGGLTAFPSEPVTSITNGVPAPGYLGVITFTVGATPYVISSTGPSVTGSMRTATFKVAINNDPVRDSYGTNYSTGALAGTRLVTATFELYDSDGTDSAAIRAASISKAPISFTGSIGTTPGNIWTFSAKGGQAAFPKIKDDTARFNSTIDVQFHESAAGLKDSFGLAIT